MLRIPVMTSVYAGRRTDVFFVPQKGVIVTVAVRHSRGTIVKLGDVSAVPKRSPRSERSWSRGGNILPLRDIDRKLIDRCLRKEPGAWNDFVDRYMGLIYHVIQHASLCAEPFAVLGRC